MNKSVLVIMEALNAFAFDGIAMDYVRYGSGHINDTYLVKTRMSNGTESRVILQRMNTSVFKEPEKLMENIVDKIWKKNRML